MNEYDSSALKKEFIDQGWKNAPPEIADVLIVNTCAVRHHAEHRAISRLVSLARARKGKINMIMGCVAQKNGQKLLDKYPCIDYSVGPGEIDRIFQIVENCESKGAFMDLNRFDGCGLRSYIKKDQLKSFVAISRGCENFCSYCIVPYVRGKLRGRPIYDILDEIKSAIDKGVKEITLLGQNVNSYIDPGSEQNFSDLLEKVNDLSGLARIRYVTNHPKDMDEKLIETIAELPKVCEAIHLPFQSGSSKILKAMNRGYSREDYIELISKITDKMPDAALTTDIIVGFPGESLEDFDQTAELFDSVGFTGAFAFKYSTRPGTVASKMEDDVPENEKIRRLELIIDLIQKNAEEFSKSMVGKEVEVLIEGVSPKNPGQLFGLTRNGRKVIFDGEKALIGKCVKVSIIKAYKWYLNGELIK